MTEQEINEQNIINNIGGILRNIYRYYNIEHDSRLIDDELFYLLVSYVTKSVEGDWHNKTSYPDRIKKMLDTGYVIDFLDWLMKESSQGFVELIENPKTKPYLRAFDMTEYKDTKEDINDQYIDMTPELRMAIVTEECITKSYNDAKQLVRKKYPRVSWKEHGDSYQEDIACFQARITEADAKRLSIDWDKCIRL